MKYTLFILVLLVACTTQTQDPNTLLQPIPETLSLHEILELRPKEKHHFNLKAPQKCGDQVPLSLTPQKMQCQFNEKGKFKVTASVCDDPESFCKVEKLHVNVGGSDIAAPTTQPQAVSTHAPEGFINNKPQEALAQAKGKLLLIDFYGTWCPPCNLLDELVFGEKNFQEATKDIVKAALDADDSRSWEWKDHFKVGGYPTLIIADSELREISRLIGYQPLPLVLKWIEESKAQSQQPVAALLEQKKLSPKETERLGKWYFQRAEWETAIPYLAGAGSPEATVLQLTAQIKIADQQGKTAESLGLLNRLISEYPKEPDLLGWASELAAQDQAAAKKLAPQVEAGMKVWLQPAELAKSGIIEADLIQAEASFLKDIGEIEKSQKRYAAAADAYGKLAAQSRLSRARGGNLERAYCLLQAGKTLEARSLYSQMVNAYEHEFAFNYNYAYALHELKELKEARTYAEKAVKYSYGDNRMRAVWLLAKVDLDLGQKDRARESLQQELKYMVLPQSTQIRTHRYVTRLRDLLAQAQK